MPGPVSQSNLGPSAESPYVPDWCYRSGPRMCPCGHHEGFHDSEGRCLQAGRCGCSGLPADCLTPMAEL